ncbi:MAG: NUDIX domain-containing protein [Terriglobia bacterium]
MFRILSGRLEVLLAHPGGPFWVKEDYGAWSIPKGEVTAGGDALSTAKREFKEETGMAPSGNFIPLGSIRQKGGKTVEAWAFEGNCDPGSIPSNTFPLEWPPRSGRIQQFPEIDRAGFFDIEEARRRINAAQAAFLSKLVNALADRSQALS